MYRYDVRLLRPARKSLQAKVLLAVLAKTETLEMVVTSLVEQSFLRMFQFKIKYSCTGNYL